MAILSYSDLQTAISTWLDRDLSARAADCISLAEADFRRQLVMPDMETIVTVSGTNPIPLPADFDSLRALVSPTGVQHVVDVVSLQAFYDLPAGGGTPSKYAIDGSSLYVWPVPAVSTSLTLAYRAKLPSLSDTVTTNWLLANHPDAYLFGSLLQAEFFGWNDDRLPLLQTKLTAVIDDITRAGNRKRYGGTIAIQAPVQEWAGRTRYVMR